MAGTVLGKRSRSLGDPQPSHEGLLTRAKKRALVILDDDDSENVIPGDTLSVDELDDSVGRVQVEREGATLKSQPSQPRTVPAKHGEHGRKIVLSPSRIDSHFKTTKSVEPTQAGGKPATPQTPRHRDVLRNSAPVTPRHRVNVVGKPVTPSTPRTLSTPSNQTKTIYNEARKVFARGADPGRLVGRERERVELTNFVNKHIQSHSGGALYVSGPPGTGKSALVAEVCGELESGDALKRGYVNCMSVKNAADIYGAIAADISAASEIFEDAAKRKLQSLFLENQTNTTYVVVLDEMDQLLNLDLNVIYGLFEWAFAPSSRLILIGIANALDLTDRFLPRLKARNLKPALVPFLPYNAVEIASILAKRARSLLPATQTVPTDFTPFLQPTAIQLIAKKVAAQTGDLRKSFDIARRAIELVESDTREKLAQEAAAVNEGTPSRTPLSENANLSSPPSTTCQSPAMSQRYNAETAPRATLAHVVRATTAAFNNGVTSRLRTLNLQQKAVLCVLSVVEQQGRQACSSLNDNDGPCSLSSRPATPASTPSRCKSNNTSPTLRTLFETYTTICRRDNVQLHALSATEFRDVAASLETASLATFVTNRGTSGLCAPVSTPSNRRRGRKNGVLGAASTSWPALDDHKVSACVDFKELATLAEGERGPGSGILKAILHYSLGTEA